MDSCAPRTLGRPPPLARPAQMMNDAALMRLPPQERTTNIITIKAGPWPVGGQQPVKCIPWEDRVHENISQIFISHGDSINSIQTAYYGGREIVLLDKHGGDGEKFDIINVDASDRLIEVSGYYGPDSRDVDEPVVIRSLRFTTRFSKYGPFGCEQGTPFSFKLGPNAFAGFHGESSDKYLHSIGIHVRTHATKQDRVYEEVYAGTREAE